jgi:hypothetical protein
VHDLIVVFSDRPRVLFAKSEGTEKHPRNRYYWNCYKGFMAKPTQDSSYIMTGSEAAAEESDNTGELTIPASKCLGFTN